MSALEYLMARRVQCTRSSFGRSFHARNVSNAEPVRVRNAPTLTRRPRIGPSGATPPHAACSGPRGRSWVNAVRSEPVTPRPSSPGRRGGAGRTLRRDPRLRTSRHADVIERPGTGVERGHPDLDRLLADVVGGGLGVVEEERATHESSPKAGGSTPSAAWRANPGPIDRCPSRARGHTAATPRAGKFADLQARA